MPDGEARNLVSALSEKLAKEVELGCMAGPFSDVPIPVFAWLCKVLYTSFDVALVWVRQYGHGALLTKTDIKSAFRLLPVGCAISCSLFETFSTFLE